MATRDELVEIPVEGQLLAGTVITPVTPLPGLLFVHGWGASQQSYLARARELAELGFICMTFDMRGHASTDEQRDTVSREHNLRDLLAAYDMLAKHPAVDAGSVGVVGSSYGGYLAAILTSLRPVRWLALRAPALYEDHGWEFPKVQLTNKMDLIAYRRRLVNPEENRALGACSAFRGDVLIVESEKDEVVPHPVIANYMAACIQARSVTSRILEGAEHGLSDEQWQRAYAATLSKWLAEMIASSGVRSQPKTSPHIAAGKIVAAAE
jgi:pimeloyl-ACP methyl ester carboxylesterase